MVIIPHHADILVFLRQQPQPQILHGVGVLIFVHHDVSEPALIIGEDIVMVTQDVEHMQHQVAEIAGVQFLQPRLIASIKRRTLAIGVSLVLDRIEVNRIEPSVLPAIDQPRQLARGPALFIKISLRDQLFEQPDLIIGVDDGVIALQPRQFGMAAQHLGADRMEGAQPRDAFRTGAKVVRHPFMHFARGLVGECDAQDLRRVSPPGRHQMRQPRGQRCRFARPRTCQHQHRAFGRQHGGALRRVQLCGVGRNSIARRRGGGQGVGHRTNVNK